MIAVSVLFPQTSLQTGTFGSSSGTSVTSATGVVDTSTNLSWVQFFQSGSVPDQGSFTLTIDSTGLSVPSGNYTGWPDPGGSLSVTLEPAPGSSASGTVTLQASF